jgi:hypothetical protein
MGGQTHSSASPPMAAVPAGRLFHGRGESDRMGRIRGLLVRHTDCPRTECSLRGPAPRLRVAHYGLCMNVGSPGCEKNSAQAPHAGKPGGASVRTPAPEHRGGVGGRRMLRPGAFWSSDVCLGQLPTLNARARAGRARARGPFADCCGSAVSGRGPARRPPRLAWPVTRRRPGHVFIAQPAARHVVGTVHSAN